MKPTAPNLVARKPYRSPRLTVYGSVRELTREGGTNRQKDGGNNAAGNRT